MGSSYRRLVGSKVLVTSGDTTFAGELAAAPAGRLELVDAALVANDGGRTPLSGRLLIEGAHVRWVQVLP
ncbi:hypothetical protein JNW90_19815 [Micromonospora sp. STR1s_5]|nr:hypothetical protein [Micromonospora sp. STR1s_5]